jgi:hypothetical protein
MVFDRFHRLLACAGLALLGCGAQTSTDYEGESLLHFSGRVELLDAQSDDLIPVLAFPADNAYWKFMDVSVHGEFPSRFTLDVFDPPPAGTLADSPLFEGEPIWTYARIAAVSPDHAPGFQYYNAFAENADCTGFDPCHRVRRDYCYTDTSSYDGGGLPDESQCYTEIRECDFAIEASPEPQNYDDCKVVETKGDPSLAADPTTHFSGFSVDHWVVYLATEAPAGSLIGRMLGEEKRVAPGYHLVKTKKRTQAQIDEANSCNGAANKVALERFNRDHPDIHCDVSPDGGGFGCDGDHSRDFAPYARRAQAEAHCPFVGDASLRLVDTASTELTIRIGYDVDNAGLGN